MGGIGKTTIAKVCYQRIRDEFEAHCFLSDVRENYFRTSGDLPYLQTKLLSRMFSFKNNHILDVEEGIAMINKAIFRKKTLLVLDDVDCSDQIMGLIPNKSSFGNGSRIIITTRNADLLSNEFGVKRIFEMDELKYEEALQLLSLSAFMKTCPKEGYLEHSKKIVKVVGGHPLALKLLGSSLRNKNLSVWNEVIEEVEGGGNIHEKIFKCLKVSYDGLDEWEKEIFLDVACFFNGKRREVVEEILNGCGFYAKTSELRYLKWKGYPLEFLPINSSEECKLIELHMCHSNLKQFWRQEKNLVELKYIKLNSSQKLSKTPNFANIPNLKRLELEDCTSLVNIHPSIFTAEKLIFLNLKDCINLTNLPSPINIKVLEVLILSGCSKVKKVPEFSGNTNRLLQLHLDGTSISNLPSSIASLSHLTILSLANCKKLIDISNAMEMTSLQSLDVSGCLKLGSRKRKADDGELGELDVRETTRRKRNDDSNNIFKKIFLWLCKTPASGIFGIPSLAGLYSLTKLNLRDCNLEEIPQGIECLVSLVELDLSGNSFSHLPTSISRLHNLKKLRINQCKKLVQFPKLPPRILFLMSKDCISLKDFVDISKVDNLYIMKEVNLLNCYQLANNKGFLRLIISWMQKMLFRKGTFNIMIPGSDIPDWFTTRKMGSSVCIEWDPDGPNTNMIRFALCVVFGLSEKIDVVNVPSFAIIASVTGKDSNDSNLKNGGDLLIGGFPVAGMKKLDHIWMFVLPRTGTLVRKISNYKEIKFRFLLQAANYRQSITPNVKVKECGVGLINLEEEKEAMKRTVRLNALHGKGSCPENVLSAAPSSAVMPCSQWKIIFLAVPSLLMTPNSGLLRFQQVVSELQLDMTSNGNMLQPQLPRFSGKNFNQWSIQMKVLYGSQELWDIVERGYTEVENQSELTNQQLVELRENPTSAMAAWDILLSTYQGEDKVKMISLRSNGEEVGDQRVVEKILRSMPRKFEHIVVAIEESKDLSTLSINSLMGSLQSHELRLKQFDVNPEEAFQMQTSFRGGSRGRRGGHGRRGGGRNYDNRSGANSENSQESSSLSRGRGSGRGRGFSRNQGGGCEPTWYLDSGCSNHMTGNRSIFVTLDESFQSEVKTGDNTRLQVKGQGDILVKTKKDTKQVTNVFYVPGLKHNLLSIGQLLQRGLKVSFQGDIGAIKDQADVLIAKHIEGSILALAF
ncbi:TMV resistance protein N-like [Cucumis melo var. makuwa]|uniref:ADP-ribosyl cyclase/cyclic ADP-ribose hydrolase n=1 Tax=Cucumis melo var. makuwa TaxID=1194695 RepID=A0A5D3BQF3_CUCMM|nr:TMV resistance protein N-like [Cucumis melo var. makuwa]